MKSEQNQLSFSLWRLLRLSSFQIGSAMGDILVTSIWNRVMISQFGIPAAPVSLLIAVITSYSIHYTKLYDSWYACSLDKSPSGRLIVTVA